MIKYLFSTVFLILFCFYSCSRKAAQENSPKPSYDNEVPELPRFLIKLVDSDTLGANTDTLLYYQKSACFGFCPTYNYTIYQNGMIRYDGIQHVDPIGTRFGLISENWWKDVETQLVKAKYFELANIYPVEEKMYIPDLPNTIIIVRLYGKRKAITDNHNAPRELKDFEIYLDGKFEELKMKKN